MAAELVSQQSQTAPCVNSYGSESGEHTGPAEWAAVLVSGGRKGRVRDVIGPLCYGHADYEERWRKAIGAITRARVERWSDQPS